MSCSPRKKTVKRTFLNTIILYSKMIISMGISLYSVSLTLKALGAEEYGLYSLVAGVIALLSFVNGAMANTVQRFLSYDIGKDDILNLSRTFKASLVIHCKIALIVLAFLEIIGTILISYILNINENLIVSAHCAFQFMVIGYALQILFTPFEALIVAKEKFYIIALTELTGSILKLMVAFLLLAIASNKIIYYSLFLFLIILIQSVIKLSYCHFHNKEIIYNPSIPAKVDKTMLKFALYNGIEAVAWVGKFQGINIILNLFYGTAINAAYAIANQVNAQASFFSSTITSVFRPQIIQSAGAGNHTRMIKLSFFSTKISFYILYTISLPAILYIDFILNTWLTQPPKYSDLFCIMMLINTCIMVLSSGLNTIVQAVGIIKRYNICISIVTLSVIPFSYIALRQGYPAYMVLFICCLIEVILFFARLFYSWAIAHFSPKIFINQVVTKCLLLTIITAPIIYNLKMSNFENTLSDMIALTCISSLLISLTFICLSSEEEIEQVITIFQKK